MIKRESYLKTIEEFIDTDFIKILTGIRRSGKTTLLHSIIDELETKGVKKDNIIYISFESLKYQDIDNSKKLNELILELTKELTGKVYLFFDEIQQVDKWEKSINGFHVDLNCDIYITGSNSMLLSSEYAILLSGRYIKINVYPFSFKEILKYRTEIDGLTITKELEKELFDEYIEYGGMPGLLELKSDTAKHNALNDIYSSIVYNDILTRYPIKKVDLFKRFSRYIMNTMGETFSSESITNYLNEMEKTTRNTILNFTNYLENAFFITKVRREDLIGKKLLKTKQKYYLADHGFHHALIESKQVKKTHVLENIVYMELKRRGYEIKIGKIYDKEIDFVCEKNGNKCYIQVCYVLTSEETEKREFDPLLKVNDQYDKYVFSMDDHDLSKNGIKHVNILDFLKGDEF